MAQRVAIAATRAIGAPVLLTITHDIGLVRLLGGDLAVMLDGVVVEQGPAAQVLDAPTHDYTRCLLAAEPGSWPIRAPSVAGSPVALGGGPTDKSTSRLDPISQQETIGLMRDPCRASNCAVLLVTYDSALAACSADRVLTLAAG